jgi:hypothetical protein
MYSQALGIVGSDLTADAVREFILSQPALPWPDEVRRFIMENPYPAPEDGDDDERLPL